MLDYYQELEIEELDFLMINYRNYYIVQIDGEIVIYGEGFTE